MMSYSPIVVITKDAKIKMSNGDQIGDARLWIEENGGAIYWRDDWYKDQQFRAKASALAVELLKDSPKWFD